MSGAGSSPILIAVSADGMRRRAAASGMDPELPGPRHDLRDRPGGAEQGDPRSGRAVSGFEMTRPARPTDRWIFSGPVEPYALSADL